MRSAATLGGNVALGKLRDLESDVITVFMAAGASVQVACKTHSRSKSPHLQNPTIAKSYIGKALHMQNPHMCRTCSD